MNMKIGSMALQSD